MCNNTNINVMLLKWDVAFIVYMLQESCNQDADHVVHNENCVAYDEIYVWWKGGILLLIGTVLQC